MNNLKYIWHFLNASGDHADLIPFDVQYTMIKNHADGFGKIDPSMENYQDMIWDWSHIRDSSEQALENLANEIANYVLKQS